MTQAPLHLQHRRTPTKSRLESRLVGFEPTACRRGDRSTIEIIGLVGFEPTASWSRTRRSTKLSHSPNELIVLARPGASYFAHFVEDSKELALVS